MTISVFHERHTPPRKLPVANSNRSREPRKWRPDLNSVSRGGSHPLRPSAGQCLTFGRGPGCSRVKGALRDCGFGLADCRSVGCQPASSTETAVWQPAQQPCSKQRTSTMGRMTIERFGINGLEHLLENFTISTTDHRPGEIRRVRRLQDPETRHGLPATSRSFALLTSMSFVGGASIVNNDVNDSRMRSSTVS